MKKSYVLENSLNVKIDIDLGEINDLLEELTVKDENETLSYRAKTLKSKFEKLRREAVEEARREFENMLDRI